MRCDERYANARHGWVRCARPSVASVLTPAGRTLHLCGTHAHTWRADQEAGQ